MKSRLSAEAVVSLVVVAAASLFVLLALHPSKLLLDTTPAGGDMGAHVWAPDYLRHHLFPHGRITGWSQDWYAGFPALTFYFPLPYLVIALLSYVLPYGVAFKLVSVSGVVGLPVAAWAFGRLLRMRFPGPALLAVATVPYLFDRYWTIWGGNIASTLAGEFSFSIGLAMALLFMGVFARSLEDGRHRGVAALLLAATLLCHLLTAAFAVIGALILFALQPSRRRLAIGVTVGVLAGAVAAFWLVPFIVRLGYSNDMGWERTYAYLKNLFPWLNHSSDTPAVYTRHLEIVVALAAAGCAGGLLLRRRATMLITGLALASALAFRTMPQGALWNARALPFWYLTLYLAAAAALAEAASAVGVLIGRRPPPVLPVGDYGATDDDDAEEEQRQPVLVGAAGARGADDAGPLHRSGGPVQTWDAWAPDPERWPGDDDAPPRGADDAHETGVGPTQGFAEERAAPGGSGGGAHGADPPNATRRDSGPSLVPNRWPAVLAPLLLAAIVWLYVGQPLGSVPSWFPIRFGGSIAADHNFVTDWANWNYSGYERKASYPEYRDIVDTMAHVGQTYGCGRAMWEYEAEEDRFGTPMALMLLPKWTNGCIGSMEGLFFESSATVPYHFLNQAELSQAPSDAMRNLPYSSLDVRAGIQHLQLLGVRYYMAISPQAQAEAAADPDLTLIAEASRSYPVTYTVSGTSKVEQRQWRVYLVADSATVAPLNFEPVVMQGVPTTSKGWIKLSVAWYDDPTRWDVPLAASGPPEWQRVKGADPHPPKRAVRPAVITNIRQGDDRIAFDVDQPGSPVLVKTSYFPNWQAIGARGPWRVTPNLMVVIPTTNHVELHYGFTPADNAGRVLTVAGLIGAGWLTFGPGGRGQRAPAVGEEEVVGDDRRRHDAFPTPSPAQQ